MLSPDKQNNYAIKEIYEYISDVVVIAYYFLHYFLIYMDMLQEAHSISALQIIFEMASMLNVHF